VDTSSVKYVIANTKFYINVSNIEAIVRKSFPFEKLNSIIL